MKRCRPRTALSPYRKQQRAGKSNLVVTWGRAQVLRPNPSAGGAASCSPAGPVEQSQRCIHDEVRRFFAIEERLCALHLALRLNVRDRLVVSTAM